MKLKSNRFAAAAAMLAAVSLAVPAEAQNRWGGDRGGRHHHRDRVDAGDVIAGVFVLGAIAAIASAASKSAREDERPRYEPRYEPRYDQDQAYGPAYTRDGTRPNGLDYAADQCVAEVERGGSQRVAGVDSVSRNTGGWQVWGQVEGGAPFSCRIDNQGQVADVTVGDPRDD